MITKSKQDWSVGKIVKVGFLTLIITDIVLTPRDGMPDIYRLTSLDGTRKYEFTPHIGLERTE